MPHPLGASPRVPLASADPAAVSDALDDIGHVVIEGVFDRAYLSFLREQAELRFGQMDTRYAVGLEGVPDSEVESYLAGAIGFEQISRAHTLRDSSPTYDELDRDFFDRVAEAGIARLLRGLLGGDFAAFRNERVIRRVDPRFRLRFVGLHRDGQLSQCSSHGLSSDREFTVWTPLCSLTYDDIPRLLLLRRGRTIEGMFDERHYMDFAPGMNGNPLLLRNFQFRDESPGRVSEIMGVVERNLDHVFTLHGPDWFSPHLSLGDVVVFQKDVWHGSYIHRAMTRPRLSLDWRVCGAFERNEANSHYSYVMYGDGAVAQG